MPVAVGDDVIISFQSIDLGWLNVAILGTQTSSYKSAFSRDIKNCLLEARVE